MSSVNTSRFLSSKSYLFSQVATPFNASSHEPIIIQDIIRKYINICFSETRSVSYKHFMFLPLVEYTALQIENGENFYK